MSGEERRKELLTLIWSNTSPVSGTVLAGHLGVSRQIIVQDIALLRAAHHDVLSTPRGYVMAPAQASEAPSRVVKVRHTDEEVEAELKQVVDMGATVKDVFVHHRVYGTVRAPLDIRSRRDVARFMDDIHSGKSSPLKNITSGYHYHTLTADSEETLDLIVAELKALGYLVE